MNVELRKLKICIVGLGYVGLPLAIEFSRKFSVIGFDINSRRVEELRNGEDATKEVSPGSLVNLNLLFTDDDALLRDCNCFIITVPTPVDKHKQPNLRPLLSASRIVGKSIGKDDLIIFESTVYPGATEEECVPVIEEVSGLLYNRDFFVGYSPERINPGDRTRTLSSIKKITSGSNPKTANFVDELYKSIIEAGTYQAESIRVAEAAKVVENTQRDLNIALMNELAIIFNRLEIDTEAVLKAAATKWNFMPFRPGLVGGHCIGVDPYYLTHKGQAIGCYPEIILAGRRLNDGMGAYISSQLVKLMMKHGIQVRNSKILLMGLSFKENCPDIRNTRIVDVIAELRDFECDLDVYDPWVLPEEALREYAITLTTELNPAKYDAIVLLVAHDNFKEMGVDKIHALGKEKHVLFDIKSIFPRDRTDLRL
ncbi:Vi polysaccharide biosynthesis UDP-N-acetylglucosamine C-6 dehydrogenase TviB [Polynucleobacter sp. MWH-UH19D]|uniref:Vi polysaccharide biosynthesis UDP-N-acetylglucosamine C-6 dehydrogenase TviB n=1 Tax=Polynucleobacter sp. MWH-UH19D TaxID=1855610 RepID=UPI003364EA1F